METHIKEANRWLRQAEYDLKASEWSQKGAFYAPACFWAQQSAAKSLRAFLFFCGIDARETRSVADLLDTAVAHEEAFRAFIGTSTSLDLYYKTSRFPDSIPGGIPAEIITEKDSKDAIRQASDLIVLVERKRKEFLPDTL